MKSSASDSLMNPRRVAAILILSVAAALSLCSCSTTKVEIQQECAQILIKEPLLFITPLSNTPYMEKTCDTLGAYFNVEIPKRVKGKVIYSKNIPGLKPLSTWDNLVKNGEVNTNEAATMAKTVGCASALTVQLLEYQQYPPFKMVLLMLWIDSDTGNVIGRLYNDVDLADSQVNYRFKNFSGQGPAKEIYEEFAYSEDLYQTAYLMPEKFKLFAAAFSTTIMFQEVGAVPWWYFWRTL